MNKVLHEKVRTAIARLRDIWFRLEGRHRFIAFSTGKDSLAMASLMYEALEPEQPVCLYSHHDLEFPSNLDYLATLKERGFRVHTARPFLEYFELMDRGIGFLTLVEAWCIPLLIGTTFLEWLQGQGAKSPREGVMFRGISGSEAGHKFHGGLELNKAMNLPAFYPMLGFTKEEILELLRDRYGLPLNPIYEHMDRTYCLCCYSSDLRKQEYCKRRYPQEYSKYYRQIGELIFDSGLIDRLNQKDKFKTREEKLYRHGFAHWHRLRAQNIVGAIKQHRPAGSIAYQVKEDGWIDTKHLVPVHGRWTRKGDEIRFWDVPERIADTLVKRMINCLDCGFCILECFPCKRFDRDKKKLTIEGCVRCGICLSLDNCMGWRHRFWRRVIVEDTVHERQGRQEELAALPGNNSFGL
jgi:3'-phosphoadenosine 5'-phosphosulfate sulfotransferase (PAPS reductase)/FAD synthetase